MAKQTLDIEITGMSCASCARRAERAPAELSGVTQARVNFANENARVTLDGAGIEDAVAARSNLPARTIRY